jgi:putative heme iron utilization protein
MSSDNAAEPKKDVLRTTDDDARRLAKELVRSARFGALGVLEPETGHPLASRVALATDIDGAPVILISTLSGHTSGLLADGRCSLLCGEPGKGDPLAHPRVTLFTNARKIERGTQEHARLRRRYLARHPKAELYVDFGDFAFFRLDPERASLNGGFGKAYALAQKDLVLGGDLSSFSDLEEGAVSHMNQDHRDAVRLYAEVLCGAEQANWRLATLDPEGMDMVAGDKVARLWFERPLGDPADLRGTLATLAKQAREKAAG